MRLAFCLHTFLIVTYVFDQVNMSESKKWLAFG